MYVSNRALGALLSQNHPDGEHTIVYLRWKIHPTECRYSTIKREALTAKLAIETLQYYLKNNLFVLVTDHAPLQWLHRVKDSNLRVLRCYLAFLPFSFQVHHRTGIEHANAYYSHAAWTRMATLGGGGGGGCGISANPGVMTPCPRAITYLLSPRPPRAPVKHLAPPKHSATHVQCCSPHRQWPGVSTLCSLAVEWDKPNSLETLGRVLPCGACMGLYKAAQVSTEEEAKEADA